MILYHMTHVVRLARWVLNFERKQRRQCLHSAVLLKASLQSNPSVGSNGAETAIEIILGAVSIFSGYVESNEPHTISPLNFHGSTST